MPRRFTRFARARIVRQVRPQATIIITEFEIASPFVLELDPDVVGGNLSN